jgi:hypothetical protein
MGQTVVRNLTSREYSRLYSGKKRGVKVGGYLSGEKPTVRQGFEGEGNI